MIELFCMEVEDIGSRRGARGVRVLPHGCLRAANACRRVRGVECGVERPRREARGLGRSHEKVQAEYRKDYSTNGRIIRVFGGMERGVPVLERGLGVAGGGRGFGENLGCFAAGEFFSRIFAAFRKFPPGSACGNFGYRTDRHKDEDTGDLVAFVI